MQKLSLNFYGEIISVKYPKDYAHLKKEIAEKYQLSLSDISEIDISYISKKIRKNIKSQIDYEAFLHSRISIINLNINESSKLFQSSLLEIQKKTKDDLTKLEMLKKKKEENKKKQEKKRKEIKNNIDDSQRQIKVLGQQKQKYVNLLKIMMKEQKNKEKELISQITKLASEIGAPLFFKIPDKGHLPIEGKNEKEKKLLKLIKKYTNNLNAQEKIYKEPSKNIENIDKQINQLNKKCFGLNKHLQNEIFEFKKDENSFIKEISDLEKKLGLLKEKEELESLISIDSKKNEKRKINKKIENVVNNLKKNIKDDVEKHIIKAKNKIKMLIEKAEKNKFKLKDEDKKYLENCQKENDKAIKEVDKWIEFIFTHSYELIETVEKQNIVNFKKFDEIRKKIELNSYLKQESNIENIGATMPYTRYDSDEALLGGGASLITSPDHSQDNIASQASKQSYVKLPEKGAYAEWTMNTTGNGVTMRFTMPDTEDGMGQNGSLDVYVNNVIVKTVNLTSYYMWQYFPSGNPSDAPGGAQNFAFDEVHFLLDSSLQVGDKIRIQSSAKNGLEYGVDFLEIEEVGEPIPQPENSYSVIDFGANPENGEDDYSAISACITAADAEGKNVYFPPGTYNINQIWRMNGENIKISGAGIWYTNIQFTNDKPGTGGISGGVERDGYCNNLEFCNMYINSNLRSRYNQQAVYKCFMDVWTNCYIHDIWQEHFECGFWMADYNGTINYSDGLKIVNCRIRNNLADGVNFCQGTSNATVYNCSIRNNGDDGLAMWNDFTMSAKDETNNIFCYNTIEFIWRAGGIAIYGGSGHKIYNNYIRDTHMSAGIHLNTTFNGHKFTNNTGIEFSNNVLIKTGSLKGSWGEEFGAIDIDGNVSGITFNNTYIYDAQHDGLHFGNGMSEIIFNNLYIYGTGTDGQKGNYSYNPHNGAAIMSYGSPLSITVNNITVANIASKGTIVGATPVDNYINLTNITINGETDLGTIENSYPNGPKIGSINTEGFIGIPEPEPKINVTTTLRINALEIGNMKKQNNFYNRNQENNKIIHPDIFCDGCHGPIIGIRYKCAICEALDFCEKCEEKYKEKHGHPLLKIKRPELCPITIKCVLNSGK